MALVAIIFVGPKDLPRVMRLVGEIIGKGREMRRHVRGAIDQVISGIEIADVDRKRKAQTASVMSERKTQFAVEPAESESRVSTRTKTPLPPTP